MSESLVAPKELHTYAMQIIVDGKMQTVSMMSAYDRKNATKSESDDAELKAAKGNDPELVDAFATEFTRCENHFRALCEGGKESVLYKHDQHIEQKMKHNATGLYASRVNVKWHEGAAAGERPPKDLEWQPAHVLDLRDAQVAKMFRKDVLEDFERMKPAASGVRLLLMDTFVWTADIKVQVRFFIYFMTEARYIENEQAHKVKFGGAENVVSARGDLTPESIHMVVMQWSLLAIQRAILKDGQSKEQAQAEAEAAWPAVQKRIMEAQTAYKKYRTLLRRRAMSLQLPLVIDFIERHLAATLVDRLEKAAPNIPDRLMMRVQLENGGQVINLDETSSITQAGLKKLLNEADAELANTVKRAEAAPQDETLKSLVAEVTLVRDCLAQRYAELAKIDPSTEIMFDVYDRGKWQDAGESIEAALVYEPHYDMLHAVVARAKREAEAAKADAKS